MLYQLDGGSPLKMLSLRGCIVSIDVMGCQIEIANTIIGQGADYVFALKGNLQDDVQELFTFAREQNFKNIALQFYETL